MQSDSPVTWTRQQPHHQAEQPLGEGGLNYRSDREKDSTN